MQTSASGLAAVALRVASVSVEAARRKKPKSSKKPKTSRRRRGPVDVTSVEEDVLKESPELACRIELDITANFEGDASKDEVLSQIRQQLLSSVKSGITSVARDLNLRSSGVTVRPLRMECDINDA